MKTGARNNLIGEVTSIKEGDVMCQVKVKLTTSGDVEMSSVMTTESLGALGIKEGDTVKIIAKAVNVLLAKD